MGHCCEYIYGDSIIRARCASIQITEPVVYNSNSFMPNEGGIRLYISSTRKVVIGCTIRTSSKAGRATFLWRTQMSLSALTRCVPKTLVTFCCIQPYQNYPRALLKLIITFFLGYVCLSSVIVLKPSTSATYTKISICKMFTTVMTVLPESRKPWMG